MTLTTTTSRCCKSLSSSVSSFSNDIFRRLSSSSSSSSCTKTIPSSSEGRSIDDYAEKERRMCSRNSRASTSGRRTSLNTNNMKNKNYRVSRATVYNTLDLLVDSGLVTKHQFGKNLSLYERAHSRKQHDHLICTDCDKIIEFCDPRIQQIKDSVESMFNVKINSHSLYFYGECNCKDGEETKEDNKEEV